MKAKIKLPAGCVVLLCMWLPLHSGAQEQPEVREEAQETVADNQKDEPIYIESDRLEIDDSKGTSTYFGDVQFRQGGTQIWADEVKVTTDENRELKKLIARGKPARFYQAPGVDVEEAEGEAARIVYTASDELVVLSGKAKMRKAQGEEMASNLIEYDSAKRFMRAGHIEGQETGRVQIVIPPRKKDTGSGGDAANGSE